MLRHPARFLLVLSLVPSFLQAANLIQNPDFTNGTAGWAIEGGTRVLGFPPTGGVDLATNDPAAGGISQCVPAGDLPAGSQLNAGLIITSRGVNGGIMAFRATSFPTTDCTGSFLQVDFFEPRVEGSKDPPDTPIQVSDSMTVPATTKSIEMWLQAAQTQPPAEFNYNLRNAVLEPAVVGPAGPDVAPGPHLNTSEERAGGEGGFTLAVDNVGITPTTGAWTATVTAPEGWKLVCEPQFTSTGNGTRQLTITGNEALANGSGVDIDVLFDLTNVTPGTYTLTIAVSGGGENNTGNNQDTLEVVVLPSRQADRVPDSPPLTTQGRGGQP